MEKLNWSKKDVKAFNKLVDDDKKAVIGVIISNAVNDALVRITPKFIITGDHLRSKSLYEKYVKKLDRMPVGSDIWMDCIEELLSDIRKGYIKYEQMNGESQTNGEKDN